MTTCLMTFDVREYGEIKRYQIANLMVIIEIYLLVTTINQFSWNILQMYFGSSGTDRHENHNGLDGISTKNI